MLTNRHNLHHGLQLLPMVVTCIVHWSVVEGEVSDSAAKVAKRWWTIGPFPSGKVEYDGDPLVPFGGVLHQFERGPGAGSKQALQEEFLAEHVIGGKVTWRPVEASQSPDGYSHVVLPHDHVPFAELMKNPPSGGSSDVLHVQYWVVGTMKIIKPGAFAIDCRGVHTFEIVKAGANASISGPLAGNIYSADFSLGSVLVELKSKGLHRLMTRIRGKVPLQISCNVRSVSRVPKLHAVVPARGLPDVVKGVLIAGPSPIELQLRSFVPNGLHVHAEVLTNYRQGSISVNGSEAKMHLSPGMVAQLPVTVSVHAPMHDREAVGCIRFDIQVRGYAPDGSQSVEFAVPVQLRCRKSTQSALLSFIDADGSVGSAAVLRPRRISRKAAQPRIPIVVSMSGVGTEPQGQADAYKMKPHQDDKGDFIFGFENLWVLVPQRGGPHNWEDVGMRTALRAIEVLAAAPVLPKADSLRLIVHGHSRGGHGAWGLATRIPDRVLGVASACGWYSREEYGDANNLWVHDTSLMHMDKMLLGLLHASIAENENSLHASNLRGIPALVRIATRDQAVPPWFGRRMARHLREEGANVTLQEIDQQHWWWDTKHTNDGGVMHDKDMRVWTEAVARTKTPGLHEILARGELTLTASSPEYEGRFGVRVLQRISPSSRAFVKLRSSTHGIEIHTANVKRFSIAAFSQVAEAIGSSISVDGVTLAVSAVASNDFCYSDAVNNRYSGAQHKTDAESCKLSEADDLVLQRWVTCRHGTGSPPLSRSLSLLGPIRRVFAAPWILVLPDRPSTVEVQLATYFTSGHFIAVGTSTQVLTLSEAWLFRKTHRFVWLGAPQKFPPSVRLAWPVQIEPLNASSAVDQHSAVDNVSWAVAHIGPCHLHAGHGLVFLAPVAHEAPKQGHDPDTNADSLLDLVVTATDPQALLDLVSFSFATNQPHTRAPMSNMLPDFFVSGPDFRWRGYGGVVAAGYWDAFWNVAPYSAYFKC